MSRPGRVNARDVVGGVSTAIFVGLFIGAMMIDDCQEQERDRKCVASGGVVMTDDFPAGAIHHVCGYPK